MENSYIKDFIINFLDSAFDNDLERIKTIYYGLDYIISNLTLNAETNEDKKTLKTLNTCLLSINEIIQNNERGTSEELEHDEHIAKVQTLYNKWVEKMEKRDISYGELTYIQGLNDEELNEMEKALYNELHPEDGKNDDFFAVCGYGKAELLEDYHKKENGNNETN